MKTKAKIGMMVLALAVMVWGGMSASAQMTTNIWRLTGDGDWAVDANWTNSGSANHQPTASEWVLIGGDYNYTTIETVTLQAAGAAGVASNLTVGWRSSSSLGSLGALVINATSATDVRLTVGGDFAVGSRQPWSTSNGRVGSVIQNSGVVNVGGYLGLARSAATGGSGYYLAGGTLNAGGVRWGDDSLTGIIGELGSVTQAVGTVFNVSNSDGTADYTLDRAASTAHYRTHTLLSGAALTIQRDLVANGCFRLISQGGTVSIGRNLVACGNTSARTPVTNEMSGGTFTVGGIFTNGTVAASFAVVSDGTMILGGLTNGSGSKMMVTNTGLLLVKNSNYSTTQANSDIPTKLVKDAGMSVDTVTVGGTLYTRVGLPPTVTIVGTVTNASESPVTNGAVSVGRGSRTDGALTVYYTISGTATPGAGAGGDFTNSPSADYVNKTGVVTIADGQTNATITIYPIDDTTVEISETVILTLSNNAAYTVGTQSDVTLTITSDDVSGNQAPMVTNAGKNVTITMGEDGAAPTWVADTLYATDNEGDTLTWTNGAVLPQNGTVGVVNFVGSNLTSYTFTPNADFNGTNTFTMEVRDGTPGNMDACTVTVVVAAINDPPVTSAVPTLSSSPGTWLFTDTWTNNSGTWNDNADTNAVYTNATFQTEKTFLYQWQWSNSPAGDAIAYATNAAFVPNDFGGFIGTNVRVRVLCVDAGVPGSVTSAPADSAWQIVFGAPVPAPVITNAGPLEVTIQEDCGETNLQAVFHLLATNVAEAGVLSWGVATSPTQGTANVSGGTTLSSEPGAFTYQPSSNRNGGDSFVVCVSNGVGVLSSNMTVNITITAVNDPPVNTVAPGFSGVRLQYNTLTATNGVWNDNGDTNATYTHAAFTNTAVFTRQWQRTDSTNEPVTVTSLANQTNATYTLTHDDKYKWLRVAVTCTDSSNGTPVNASTTAYSSWLRETSTVPTVVFFTNALNDGAWGSYSNWAPDDVPSASITAVIGDPAVRSPVVAAIGGG